MSEQSYFLHSPVALSGLALLCGFILLISFVPMKEGNMILGVAIALGAAAGAGVSVRMLQDRVYVDEKELEVHDLWGNRLATFSELQPGDVKLVGFSLLIKTTGVKVRRPFEVTAGAKYYYPLLEALHTALDADGSGRGTQLLEALREQMLAALFGGGSGAADMIGSPVSQGLAEAGNQRLINGLRAFLEERLGPTPGLRPIKRKRSG